MSESGETPKDWNWKMFLPSWLRHGRENVNLDNVTTGKLQDAHDKRGIVIDDVRSTGSNTTATVNKEVVKGDGPLAPPS